MIVFINYSFIQNLEFDFLPPIFIDFLHIIITLIFSYIEVIILLALINKIARLLLKDREGDLEGVWLSGLWWVKETSWDIAYTLTNKLFFHSPFPDFILRIFGFHKEPKTAILGRIMDPEMVTIGAGTLVGTGAIISGHHIRRGIIFRKKVTIGKNCTIGGYTIVLPGAEIEDNVHVSTNSTVPANWKLESNAIYSGSPVKKIKDLDS